MFKMVPYVKDPKQFASRSETKSLHDELMEKLKLDEEKEKKKSEKEAKRRAELEKVKQESLQMQASLITSTKNKSKKLNTLQKKSKQKSTSSAAFQSKSSYPANENNDAWDERASSSSVDSAWSSQNSYVSKARSTSQNSQQTYSSKSKYNQGNSYQSSRRRNDSNSSYDSYQRSSRCTPVSDSLWDDTGGHFPSLGVEEAPVPKVNVWAERMYKAEEMKALEPQNENDEEAMLRHALELSTMEAKEEERRKKMEEEYKLQTEILEANPALMEEFTTSDNDFACTNQSEYESSLSLHSPKEDEHSSMTDKASGVCKRKTILNSEGAKPNVGKIIDSFGGWGWKDSDKNNKVRSEKLSDYDIEEKYTSTECNDGVFSKKDTKASYKNHDKNVFSNNSSDTWFTPELENSKKTVSVSDGWGDEILYDGEETFIDEDNLDFATTKDSQHFAYERNVVGDKLLKGKTAEVETQGKSKFPETKRHDSNMKMNEDSLYLKSYRIENSTFSHVDVEIPNKSSVDEVFNTSESHYRHDVETDATENLFTSSKHETLQLPNPWTDQCATSTTVDLEHDALKLSNSGPWGERSASSTTTTFCDKLKNELKDDTFGDAGNSQFIEITSDSNSQAESPHIFPPQPPIMSTMNDMQNNGFTNDNFVSSNQAESHIFQPQPAGNNQFIEMTSDSNSQVESPHIFSPQPPIMSTMNDMQNNGFTNENFVSSNQAQSHIFQPQPIPSFQPQFPAMNPLFPSPAMFPTMLGFNPFIGYGGMDPVMMRQMLMLSNPFFASQLLAMEQYYKANGMPTDVMAFPPQAAQNPIGAPGVTSQQPIVVANTMISNNLPGTHSQFPNQLFNNQHMPAPENTRNSSKCVPPPGLDAGLAHPGTSSATPDNDVDSWFKSYLTSDSSPIPPPKPLTSENDVCDVPISAPKPPQPKQTSRWSDSEDEDCSSKAASKWGGDDSWGDCDLPTKPVKSFEDRPKPTYRQPASQPQISRFKPNKMYK